MAVKARISPGYRWRLVAIAVLALGWGVWSVYDGFYAYPRHDEHVIAFNDFKLEHPEDWMDLWPREAEKRGWSPKDPGERHSNMDIYIQYLMALVTLPIGVIFSISFLRAGSRWIASDGATLSTSWGQSVNFDAITTINKDRWGTKGIAVVHYPGNGQEARLVLDDWKYQREPIAAMVKQVDEHLGIEESSGD